MEPGRASRTAELVCMGRALADARQWVPGFRDPTAEALLPEASREMVQRARAGEGPRGFWQWVFRGLRETQAKVMAVRTRAIDGAVVDAGSKQVVILGAGLDGRAWRMPELRNVVVFEVDHPDSQRDKQARAAALTRTAKEVRFVPVDFSKDDLDAQLTAAGHDPSRTTTWIWEGVVMYLKHDAIEATLRVIEKRSCPRSQLVILYHSPALIVHLVGFIVRRLGEALQSSQTPDQMRTLLAAHGFTVMQDEAIPTLANRLAPEVTHDVRHVTHLRTVVAVRG